MKMKYNHTGLIAYEKMDGMDFVEPLKVWITHASAHPYKIEYLYFEPDSPMPAAVQDEPHVSYVVEDIEEAIKGKSILWPVTDMGKMKLAFVYEDGLTIEFNEMKK